MEFSREEQEESALLEEPVSALPVPAPLARCIIAAVASSDNICRRLMNSQTG